MMTKAAAWIAAMAGVVVAAMPIIKMSSSTQKFLYRLKIKRDYERHSLHPEDFKITDGAGSETIVYFDSKSPRSQRRPGAPILLLHGFTADKETWLEMVGLLCEDHRVIALDLAGHGNSSDAADGDYGRVRQTERAHRLSAELELERFHVLGHSMGGAVAITFAIKYADDVLSLGLIAPAGLKDVHTAEFHRHLDAAINPLIVTNEWTASDKIRFVTNGPRWFHFAVWLFDGYLTQLGRERARLYKVIFQQLNAETPLTDEDLQHINQPTFILWGTADRVLRPEQAHIYADRIPGLRALKTWKGAGHALIVERPRETAKTYLEFLAGLTAP